MQLTPTTRKRRRKYIMNGLVPALLQTVGILEEAVKVEQGP